MLRVVIKTLSKAIKAVFLALLKVLPMVLSIILLFLVSEYNISTTISNLSLLGFISVLFILMLSQDKNKTKMVFAVNIFCIAFLNTMFNLSTMATALTWTSFFESWTFFWCLILLCALIYAVYIIAITLKWPQEKYDIKRENISDTKLKKADLVTNGQNDRYKIKNEIKNAQIKKKLARIKDNAHQQTPIKVTVSRIAIFTFIAVAIFAYFFIPTHFVDEERAQEIKENPTAITRWFSGMEGFIQNLDFDNDPNADGNENSKSTSDSLLTYSTGFITAVSVLLATLFLIWQLVLRFTDKYFGKESYDDKDNDFLKNYTTPITILVLGVCFIYATAMDNSSDFEFISALWKCFVRVIFALLIIMVAIDSIKTSIDQCIDDDSLLRKSIKYVFISIINFTFEVIFGILSNIDIKGTISSIVHSVFGTERSSTNIKINEKFEKSLLRAIDQIDCKPKRKKGRIRIVYRKEK